jgi:hypothetical protein
MSIYLRQMLDEMEESEQTDDTDTEEKSWAKYRLTTH